MDEKEFNKNFDEVICTKLEGVRTKKQIEEFLSKQMNTMLDLNNLPPVKLWYIEDPEDSDSSYWIFLCHHMYTDVVQIFSTMAFLSDNFDTKNILKIRGIPTWKVILGKIMAPIYTLRVAANILMAPAENNVFINPKPKVPDRAIVYSE